MSEPKPEYEAGEAPRAWASIKKSSSKDGGIGFEYGYSDPTGNVEEVLTMLRELRRGVEALLTEKEG